MKMSFINSDNVKITKEIENNLVSIYKAMGWFIEENKIAENKIVEEKNKKGKKEIDIISDSIVE